MLLTKWKAHDASWLKSTFPVAAVMVSKRTAVALLALALCGGCMVQDESPAQSESPVLNPRASPLTHQARIFNGRLDMLST